MVQVKVVKSQNQGLWDRAVRSHRAGAKSRGVKFSFAEDVESQGPKR